jgi:predicted acetylornithine/succinylornithine family transaminase
MGVKEMMEDSNQYLMNTYARQPVVLRKGRGIKVWSSDGNEYLDFVGGVATNALGHCHPKVVVALQKQAQRLLHVSNHFHIEPQIKLAKGLVKNSFASKAFFCNSGAEANETAIKLARKYFHKNGGPVRFEIITALESFHGRTLATLAATGQKKLQDGFDPLPPGFHYVPFNDTSAIEEAITPRTCAVMLEPIQGETGVRVPSPDYLKEVREICDKNDLLLILDEVQTGMGRTGRLFAHEHFGISPDIMTLAKGLGGGVPIGAVLATEKVSKAFNPGDHGSTFGGNPLVCSAAIATLEAILEGGFLLDQCKRMGDYLTGKLQHLKKEFSSAVVEIRGMGLLVGIELTSGCAPIVKACMERGLLVNCASGNVLRFMPPLIVQKEDIDQTAKILEEVFKRIL